MNFKWAYKYIFCEIIKKYFMRIYYQHIAKYLSNHTQNEPIGLLNLM
jgi:hypothetical protein